MLLFIFIAYCSYISYNDFNTSHVTVYLHLLYSLHHHTIHFNTSHVTVYHPNCSSSSGNGLYFNTSHVTVYQCLYPLLLWILQISIHLMLLFISIPIPSSFDCTCISIHLMLLFISDTVQQTTMNIYFNTSHVTVYPVTRTKGQPMVLAFQYISCYCLSEVG